MRRALLASCTAAAILIACGSRGPLDDAPATSADGGGLDAVALDGATPADARPRLEAGPAACAACVITTCGPSIVDCLGAEACVGVFSCVATRCLATDAGTGGLNTQCLLGCATQNPAGALQVLQVFQCVTGTCSPDCGSLLGGLGGGTGGLGGLGGLFGGGGGGGSGDDLPVDLAPVDRTTFEEVFSPWPGLVSKP